MFLELVLRTRFSSSERGCKGAVAMIHNEDTELRTGLLTCQAAERFGAQISCQTPRGRKFGR